MRARKIVLRRETEQAGHRLRKARRNTGMSQAALARELNVSAPTVTGWECSTRAMNISDLIRAARVLGVHPADLLPGPPVTPERGHVLAAASLLAKAPRMPVPAGESAGWAGALVVADMAADHLRLALVRRKKAS